MRPADVFGASWCLQWRSFNKGIVKTALSHASRYNVVCIQIWVRFLRWMNNAEIASQVINSPV